MWRAIQRFFATDRALKILLLVIVMALWIDWRELRALRDSIDTAGSDIDSVKNETGEIREELEDLMISCRR